ncbi:MAG: SUMF1/EgtB/PvdO family nonheme iron enzyme, partial [Pseudomonadota bacterium]
FELHPIGKKPHNPWGLYDMAGNIHEWVHDGYKEDLGSGAVTDPWGAPAKKWDWRVLRGKAYNDVSGIMRAAYRDYNSPKTRDFAFGFRCARTILQ